MNKVNAFVITVCGLALVVGTLLPWGDLTYLSSPSLRGLAVMVFLSLVAERLTMRTSLGAAGVTHSVGFLPVLATVVLFGGPAAMILVVATVATSDFLLQRRPAIKATFNVGQYALSAGVAGLLYGQLGGHAVATNGFGEGAPFDVKWASIVAFGLCYMALNQVLVAKVISLSSSAPFTEVWRRAIGKGGSNFVFDVLISPVAVAIALLGMEFGSLGLLIATSPLLAIRSAYLTNHRLQESNRDLLTALVKAIETRDPYTSGHSVRVGNLSVLLAQRMGLSQRFIADLHQSALLHDVGKIDAVYTQILGKRDSLTKEERRMIESHVTKGVELLETLSSVPKVVIEDVRHHHERWDGRGYPDGIAGTEIPLGARIICVCDAVDAMLSDRPYRAALSVETVRKELIRYGGIQFDPGVVDVIVSSDALEAHLGSVDRSKMDTKARAIKFSAPPARGSLRLEQTEA